MTKKSTRKPVSARLRYTLYGALFGALFPVVSTVLFVITSELPFNLNSLAQAQANNPLQWIINTAPLFLGLFAFMAGARQDRVESMNRSMETRLEERATLIEELSVVKAQLQQTVNRQLVQLKTAAEVARETLIISDRETLLQQTTRLISDRFGFYHTGIFLLDPNREYAVLRAASSEGGRRMLARQHKLRVGEVGIVGYVASKGVARIALDVGVDAVYFNNPDLPQTSSEMALPLKVHDTVIGVLDVQSTQTQAFSDDDVNILQTLADQIALAIENARLLDETRQALRELQNLYQLQESQGWQNRPDQRNLAFQYDLNGVRLINGVPAQIMDDDQAHTIHQPIQLRGKNLGDFIIQRDAGQAPWSQHEIGVVRDTMNQVALSLENARLLQETSRRADRERVVTEISSRLWASTDIHTILRTALEDLGRTLEVADAIIQLDLPAPTTSENSGGNHGQQT
jgi:GAF domain-containing protein